MAVQSGIVRDNDKSENRKLLKGLLGDLPVSSAVPAAAKVDEREMDGYILETLLLDLNGIEPVPAYFARPKGVKGKSPVVLYNHAHGGDYVTGKDEFVRGRPNCLQDTPFAEALARLGFSALCIDHWCFGERRGKSESATFKEMLWNGQVLWGMMMYDSIRALDYLSSRDDVDMERVGTLGLSMGSTMAWWLAALDTRVKTCVDICCLTDFHALIKSGGLDYHSIYYYVPGLLKHFSTAKINALIAPRAHLSLAGLHDVLTPPEGLDAIDKELKKIYSDEGALENWRLSRYHTGHFETAAMRREILDFIMEKL
ncbi:MAG: acetylxylan esterase [Victivallales bacterium]